MLSSLAVFGLEPFGRNLADAIIAFVKRTFDGRLWVGDFPAGFGFLHAAALCLAALLFTHLILNLATTTVRTVNYHQRHRQLIDLLSTPVPGKPRTRQIAADTPFAYCLPGLMNDLTVVSEGLVRRLTPEQLDAVIAHEHAHLGQRHTVVLTVFAAWASALPWFPIANRAQQSVALLIEMLADDLALRRVSRQALVDSIRVVALGQNEHPDSEMPVNLPQAMPGQPAPSTRTNHEIEARDRWGRRTLTLLWAAPAIANPVELRVQRLLTDAQPLDLGARVALIASSGILLVLPPLAIFQ